MPDPPLALFVHGEVSLLSRAGVAVVGARQCTSEGARQARRLCAELASAGVTIVSGLAQGIDAAAHQGCLDVQGATVAVLGHGLSHLYPASNRALSARIVKAGGLLVSEYPGSLPPRRHQFPERNRIISGLALGVIVAEASEKSGSLITARMALEQGRDVFAVPGPVQSLVSAGCHGLIQQGAGLVTNGAQVLAALGWEVAPSGAAGGAGSVQSTELVGGSRSARLTHCSEGAQRVYAALSGYPIGLDELHAQLQLPLPEVLRGISELELEGIVSAQPLGYIRTS